MLDYKNKGTFNVKNFAHIANCDALALASFDQQKNIFVTRSYQVGSNIICNNPRKNVSHIYAISQND